MPSNPPKGRSFFPKMRAFRRGPYERFHPPKGRGKFHPPAREKERGSPAEDVISLM